MQGCVVVKRSLNEKAGNGLFATQQFEKGQNVAYITGIIIASDSVNDHASPYLVYWKQGFILDATLSEAPGKYANSAYRDPLGRKNNAKLTLDRRNRRACIKALAPIKAGEEILISYGRQFQINLCAQK